MYSTSNSYFCIYSDFAKIVLKPRNVTVMINGSALFNCGATGVPEPGIYWYTTKDKNPTNFKPVNFKNSRTRRFPNNSILLTNIRKNDVGWYQCIAGNAGYIEQALAHLKVGLNNVKTTGMYLFFT